MLCNHKFGKEKSFEFLAGVLNAEHLRTPNRLKGHFVVLFTVCHDSDIF